MDCCNRPANFFSRWFSANYRELDGHGSRISRNALAGARPRPFYMSSYSHAGSTNETCRRIVDPPVRSDHESVDVDLWATRRWRERHLCAAFRKRQNVHRLVMINNCDLARVRPGICASYEAGSNGILTNVVPFLRIAFCTSQNVDRKSRAARLGHANHCVARLCQRRV